MSPLERRAFDYSDLEAWMAHADQAIRQTWRVLDQIASLGVHERAQSEAMHRPPDPGAAGNPA